MDGTANSMMCNMRSYMEHISIGNQPLCGNIPKCKGKNRRWLLNSQYDCQYNWFYRHFDLFHHLIYIIERFHIENSVNVFTCMCSIQNYLLFTAVGGRGRFGGVSNGASHLKNKRVQIFSILNWKAQQNRKLIMPTHKPHRNCFLPKQTASGYRTVHHEFITSEPPSAKCVLKFPFNEIQYGQQQIRNFRIIKENLAELLEKASRARWLSLKNNWHGSRLKKWFFFCVCCCPF